MNQSSLVVVGVGIKFVSHISVEAKACIQQSDKVLYLVNDPLMKDWILQLNPSSESLDYIYTNHTLRSDSYKEISNFILEQMSKYQHLCVVLYGHPAVFAEPALDAVKRARSEGRMAKILPAISAEDCLFADLLIDPGSCGCQSFEATDFLIYQRRFDVSCHLVLWQVGVIGSRTHAGDENSGRGVLVLSRYLQMFYPGSHNVIVYEASLYPHIEPRIENIPIEKLVEIKLSKITTLYVPPLNKANCDDNMLKDLGMKR